VAPAQHAACDAAICAAAATPECFDESCSFRSFQVCGAGAPPLQRGRRWNSQPKGRKLARAFP
jgi:hypothetical protein